MEANRCEPSIFANRNANAHAFKQHGFRHGARCKNPLFIKGSVIGQLMLVTHGSNLTAIEQRDSVVQCAIVEEYRTHKHGRPAIGCRLRKLGKLHRSARGKGWLQHQILGRIPNQLLFGKHDQVGICRFCAPFQHLAGVTCQVTHALVKLRHCNIEPICHFTTLLSTM